MKRLLIFLSVLCLISCGQYYDTQTIVQIQEKNVSPELVEKTRQQLIQRLQKIAFQDVQVEQRNSPIQLVISTKMQAGNDKRLQQYHNAFEKGSELGMWYTYRRSDPEMREVSLKLSTVPHLQFYDSQSALFASLTNNDSLSVVAQKIEKLFADFKNLRFLWSAKPDVHLGTYRLYAIDTRGNSIAPITNEHILDARHKIDRIYDVHIINVEMNEGGALIFGKMTQQALHREIAMVVDGRVHNAPNIQVPITNGKVQIPGDYNAEEAAWLARTISQPPLPYTLKIIDEKIIS